MRWCSLKQGRAMFWAGLLEKKHQPSSEGTPAKVLETPKRRNRQFFFRKFKIQKKSDSEFSSRSLFLACHHLNAIPSTPILRADKVRQLSITSTSPCIEVAWHRAAQGRRQHLLGGCPSRACWRRTAAGGGARLVRRRVRKCFAQGDKSSAGRSRATVLTQEPVRM